MDNQSQTPPKRSTHIGMSSFEKGIFTESLIFHIPHSSVHIPFTTGFEQSLIQSQINLLTDVGTDLIFNVPNTERLVTPFSRVFCDVERLPDDEEEMFKSGRGFFYTHCDNGDKLREDIDGIKQRIYEEYYVKHHQKLEQMIEERITAVGFATIIDCHSFTNTPFESDLTQFGERPDICIGTSKTHTPEWLLYRVNNFYKESGAKVEINFPYSGTIVPKKYENKANVHSIMIEINRDLYQIEGKTSMPHIEHLNKQVVELFD